MYLFCTGKKMILLFLKINITVLRNCDMKSKWSGTCTFLLNFRIFLLRLYDLSIIVLFTQLTHTHTFVQHFYLYLCVF